MTDPTERQRDATVWTWRRWTRWPLTPSILVVAGLAVGVDTVTAWRSVGLGSLGRVPTSPALPVGLLLAVLVGLRRLGLDRANLAAWREFLVVSGVVLLVGAWHYSQRVAGVREAVGLVLDALDEELVYRLAVLILVGAATAFLLRRNWRNPETWGLLPGVVAIGCSGVLFTLLPGHVAQISSTLRAVPFMSFGVVLAYVVLRTGALLPAAAVHASLNLVTIAALTTGTGATARTVFAATALVALVLGTIVAGIRLGMLQRRPMRSRWRYAQ